ncbi:SDR family NAD(P)-dependent oxidoreductase [Belliella sp. DSM 111904]|uniref:SDR family NAD(P)-dependent oxidoreductase n=1 Tax=Belliella filtrata TaxID=2923435 RepID=A0ABS9UVS5_9BACT|nr:SDR family NAD(P)-dependent oxidoreductase [Belliella filtrata]MCH7408148.1 SDR family NAD(P)-dependent oxidoreductase [Belliella filtrata]
MELNNSTILITGGTSGIGLEFVKQLTEKGANIIITGRSLDRLKETKKKFPKVHIFQSDVSIPQDIEQLYKSVTQQFPELNIIINNAGIMRNLNLRDTSIVLENITQEIETNLSGVIRVNHQFLPHLKTKTSAAIVNISSGLAFLPFPLSPVYSATKSGVHAYSKVLRLQLKKTNVKVFEIAPPLTETTLMNAFTNDIDKESAGPAMKVEKMVAIAIKGITNDKLEIKPGMSKALYFMGRIAPKFFLNLMDKTLEKAKRKKEKVNLIS